MGTPLTLLTRRMLALALGAMLIAPRLPEAAPEDHVVEQRVNPSQAGWPLAEFELTDHQGNRLTRSQLREHWTFMVFGDTHGAAPCRDALAALAGMLRRIAPTAAVKTVQVIFVSLDPERDTPALLRDYVVAFDNRFIGATGPPDTLRHLLDDTGVADSSRALPDDLPRQGDRGSLVLIGPDGVVRAEYLPPFDVKRLTAEFLITRSRR